MSETNRFFSTLITGILYLFTTAAVLPAASLEREESEAVVKGNTAFALELYRRLGEREGNIFLSPHSITTALAMTYAGAREKTAAQMANVLRFSLDSEALHPALAELTKRMDNIQREGDIQLRAANSLWPQKDYPFLEEYLDLLKKYYGVTVTPMDYKRAAETARQTINRWVEEETRDKIKNLLQPGILNALTRLVLVNAIYFKGNWASRFDETLTREDVFFLLSGKRTRVPLMRQEHEFRWAEMESMQILELPYNGDQLSMMVLLPRRRDGLPDLERQLTAENLSAWTACLRPKKVRLFLPRFKITSRFRLDQTLMSMGMVDAFDAGKANFAGMDGHPNWLYIGAVIHQAFVDVTEEGTEAAAATAVVMRLATAKPISPPVFRADHPFLFLIRENKTGSILFMGRVADPARK